MLKGKRILLRPPEKKDAKSIYDCASDKNVARYTRLPQPYPKNGALEFIKKTAKQRKAKTAFVFAIIDTKNKQFIGTIGLHKIDWRDKHAELGYVLAKKHWGQGYATEAVELAVDYAFTKLKLNRVYAHVFVPNLASCRVLEKNGFVREGTMRQLAQIGGTWQDARMYGLLREEHMRRKL